MDEKYRLIVEGAKDAIIIISEGLISYINPYGAQELGYSREEMIGNNFLDFVGESSKKTVEENYRRTLGEKQTFLYEADFQKKDGSLIPAEIRAQKVELDGKSADLVFIRDIRKRKKAEEVFHLQEERFHTVTENIPDVVARFDRDSRYVYINAAGEKVMGKSKEEIFWKTDEDLGVQREKAEAFKDAIGLVFEKKEKKTFYSETVVNGERKYFYTVLVPEFLKDGEVNSVLSITRDITEIRELDQVKSEFISITSHQLRSPLSVINWCALSLLRGEVGDVKEEQQEYLERIHESARKLIKVSDVFLNTTMLDLEMLVFNPRNIDIVTTGEETIREFEHIIKRKKIKFTKDYNNLSMIKFDPRILKIIFRGMISNALEYTPEGGTVELIIKKDNTGKYLLMEFGDDGCGVPQDDQKKIFTKFYRAEPARNIQSYGTGLDLYLIKSVLEKIGGSVEVVSPNPKFQRGVVFYIKIPLLEEKETIS